MKCLTVLMLMASAPLMAQQDSTITARIAALWPVTVAPPLPSSAGTAPQGPVGADTVPATQGINFAWTRDQRGFFYTSTPHPGQLYYHWVRKTRPDLLVYESPDGTGADTAAPRAAAGVDTAARGVAAGPTVRADMSSDGNYVIITATHPGDTHTRLLMVDLDDPDHPTVSAPVVNLYNDLDASYHYVGSYGRALYILTDREAPHGKIVTLDATDPRRVTERVALAEGPTPLVYAHSVSNRIFAAYRDSGFANDMVRITSLLGFQISTVPLPSNSSVDQIAWGGRDDKDTAYIVAQSLLVPPTVYGYAMRSSQTTVARAPAATVDTTQFETRIVRYDSAGNTKSFGGMVAYVTMRRTMGSPSDVSHHVWVDTMAVRNGAGLHFSPTAIVWMEHGGVYIAPVTASSASWRGAEQYAIMNYALAEKYGTAPQLVTEGAAPSLADGPSAAATWLTHLLAPAPVAPAPVPASH